MGLQPWGSGLGYYLDTSRVRTVLLYPEVVPGGATQPAVLDSDSLLPSNSQHTARGGGLKQHHLIRACMTHILMQSCNSFSTQVPPQHEQTASSSTQQPTQQVTCVTPCPPVLKRTGSSAGNRSRVSSSRSSSRRTGRRSFLTSLKHCGPHSRPRVLRASIETTMSASRSRTTTCRDAAQQPRHRRYQYTTPERV